MGFVLAAYALLAALELVNLVFVLPMSAHMIAAASLTVFIGSHLSLAMEVSEKIEHSDAMQLPFIAAGGLGALFLAFKYLDNTIVNQLVNAYFVCIGVACVGGLLTPVLRRFITSRRVLIGTLPVIGVLNLTAADLVAYFLGLLASSSYGACKTVWTGHPACWTTNNLLGIAFATQGIERLALGQFSVAALLLSGLFFYDIFMVFYTPLMVSVATKLDGPIKLLFPRVQMDPEAQQFSLLGLGDIVVPGIAIALLLRYDALRAVRAGKFSVAGVPLASKALLDDPFQAISASFPKPMFNAAMWAYAAGLMATVVVMVSFNHAQPALLYLVPAVLITAVFMALVRGEWTALLAFRDEDYVNAVVGTAAAATEGVAAAASTGKKGDNAEAGAAVKSMGSDDNDDGAAAESVSADAAADEAKPASGLVKRTRRRAE